VAYFHTLVRAAAALRFRPAPPSGPPPPNPAEAIIEAEFDRRSAALFVRDDTPPWAELPPPPEGTGAPWTPRMDMVTYLCS
jgi:hypothetical protein